MEFAYKPPLPVEENSVRPHMTSDGFPIRPISHPASGCIAQEELLLAGLPRIPTADSYGGVLFSNDGRVLIREPIDHLDGYVWTWPKGRPERGEQPAQTALREVLEETGYHARIVGVLPRVYIGTTRTNAFYLMEPIGEQGPVLNETAQTRWVEYHEAYELINHNLHAVGRKRDHAVLCDAFSMRLAVTGTRLGLNGVTPRGAATLNP